MTPDQVKWLQVEATSKCNAWCPGCARNNNGFGLAPNLTLEDLDTARFKAVLELLPNLETIHFCGTFGDAIAAHNIVELLEVAKLHCKKIQLNTNGSLRTTQWWTDVASVVKDIKHDFWFCLDGLADTHSIYRQGTDFDTIVANAQAFIAAGGTASWQFIPWAHNEHQIKDCMRLSQQLGFKHFRFVRDVRTDFQAQHYRTGQPVVIQPWSKNSEYSGLAKIKVTVTKDDCMHLTQPSVYLNASGKLSVCCYINKLDAVDQWAQLADVGTELETSPRSICMAYCGKHNV